MSSRAFVVAAILLLSTLCAVNFAGDHYFAKCHGDNRADRFVDAELSCSQAVKWAGWLEWLSPGRYTRAIGEAGVAELMATHLAPSREHLQQALDRYEAMGLGDSPERATVMDYFAILNWHEAKLIEGEQWARRAVEMFDRQGFPCNASRLDAIFNVALFMKSNLDNAGALAYLEAKKASILQCTDQAMSIGVFWRGLGDMQEANSQSKAALESFDMAIASFEEAGGADAVQNAFALVSRANLYNEMRKLDLARADINAALPILEAGVGPRSEPYALALTTRADSFRLEKRLPEALEEYAKAERILAEVFGKRHPRYADVLRDQAGVLYDAGNGAQALAKFQEALSICIENFGEKDERTEAVRSEIGVVQRQYGKPG